MARFSIRYTVAALALSIATLAAAPITPALAAPTQATPGPDFSFSMSTDNASARSRQQMSIRVKNEDTFTVSINAPLIKTSGDIGSIRPIGSDDPDPSDNNVSGEIKTVGGVRID